MRPQLSTEWPPSIRLRRAMLQPTDASSSSSAVLALALLAGSSVCWRRHSAASRTSVSTLGSLERVAAGEVVDWAREEREMW